ncbi:undecaprenyl-phosphate glucose phosphotransferase [Chromohalobacter israelensis]|uniref:undecaprenyl-phosphate glucose phosphotransferase n=1 Tax=Chromohalobacter israelensis TaxID=141390 RepID=UPI000A03F5A6|nr:undecaprenyl-phosphate glucose phosphotransferase [Chromohalobacter israelensis]MDF9435903.1 undecaprenyl-phosphate glucose phosphotransferase [Chromohalobacter israelensis]
MRQRAKLLMGFGAYTSAVVRLTDLAVVLLAGWVAYWWRFDSLWMIERYEWGLIVGALLSALVLPNFGVYQSWRGRVRAVLVLRIFLAYLVIGGALTFILFFSKLGESFSRLWIFAWISGAAFLCVILRLIAYPFINRLRAQGRNRRSVLLIGDAHSCATAYYHLREVPSAGFDVGRILLTDADEAQELSGVSSEKYNPGVSIEHEEEEVWICLPLSQGETVKAIQSALSLSTGNVRYMPDMRDFRLINHNVSNVASLFLLDLSCTPMTGWSRLLKAFEDRFISMAILILISPVLAVLALGVKLSSAGPVFYRQERVGWNGKPFYMLKFRSMPIDVEKDGVQWGGAMNKKTTRFGAFIRRTSLDELPQFINVLKGDMSIVGPRPERTVFVDRFKHEIPGYMQKHMVKAGITGWAQINGWRGDTDLAKRIECDLWYIENWSLWLDCKIIFLTVFKGFLNQNAY